MSTPTSVATNDWSLRPASLRIKRRCASSSNPDLALRLALAHDRLQDPPLHREGGFEFEAGLDRPGHTHANRRRDDKPDDARVQGVTGLYYETYPRGSGHPGGTPRPQLPD